MLTLIDDMRGLDFRGLLEIYRENEDISGTRYACGNYGQVNILRAEQGFYQYLREVFFCTSGAQYALWVAQGRYAAALRFEPYRDGVLIEALETAPDLRGRGYASILLESVVAHLSSTGCGRIYSHIKKDNEISIHLHEKCGFRLRSDSASLIDGSFTPEYCTFSYEL